MHQYGARANFIQSLFGMNVNLLENNPDWRWYLAIGALFLLLTVAIWIIFKAFSVSSPTH